MHRYLEKTTGLGRAQITRLIAEFVAGAEVKAKPYLQHRFAQRYTREDTALLVAVDAVHESLSGPATRKLLERAYHEFGDTRYERLARISVAQLYRLRSSVPYRQRRIVYRATRPTPVNIGERRRSEPDNRPGYLRVDTVHQGDLEGVKGVYHINAMDEVT